MIFILMVTVKNEKKICCGSLGLCKISPHALALAKSQEPKAKNGLQGPFLSLL